MDNKILEVLDKIKVIVHEATVRVEEAVSDLKRSLNK